MDDREGCTKKAVTALTDPLLDDRLAIVGTSGSGKTYAAKGFVERLIGAEARVCIVDPLGVWWGLRAGAEGDSADGLPVTIFGGLHGDAAISEDDGTLLAEVIAGASGQCIVDVSELGSNAAQRRFMTAFATALYDANRASLHLVLDEADMWAPQRPLPAGLALSGKISEIVRRGRVRGFVPWLITQRAAVLDKDVLSMADALIAMKLTLAHDRAAIGAWIKGQADREEGERILAELPRLQRGEGFVWAPGHDVLEKVLFPPIATFDSSRTPRRGEHVTTARGLRPIDAAGVAGLLESARAAHAPPAAGRAPRHADIEQAYQRGVAAGRDQARDELLGLIRAIGAKAHEIEGLITGHFYPGTSEPAVAPAAVAEGRPAGTPGNGVDLSLAPAPRRTPRLTSKSTPADGTLHAAARALLAALAQRAPAKLTWQQAATLAGLKARGGHFNAGRQQLRAERLVIEDAGLVRASDEGVARSGADAARSPASPSEIRDLWCQRLPSPAPEMLRTLAAIPNPITVTELASLLGKQPRGGHWNSGIALLRNNGLITVDAGVLALAAELRG